MASIFRRFRNFFGGLRSCITSTKGDQESDEYKFHDAAYYWKNGSNENVKLVSFRMLSDSKEDLQEMTERNHQSSTVSSQAAVPSSNEALPTKDILLETRKAEIPFPMITNFPDVIVKVGEDHKFPTTKKVLCDYSDYFYEKLASKKEILCVLKVDEKFVNPDAFKTILRFLCFKQPFTCQNLTTEVIRAATYLRMPLIICKIEMILYHRMGSVENALAKLALISEMREQLENCPPLANDTFNETQVTFKGQRGNLKDKHLIQLSNVKRIQKKKEWFLKASIEGDEERSIFEKIAMRPHILVEEAESLTLWAFNVFEHNYKKAVHVGLEEYRKSLEDSLQACTEYLANRIEEVALRSDCLNKALIDMIDEAMRKLDEPLENLQRTLLKRAMKEERLMRWELLVLECKVFNPELQSTRE